MDESNIATYLGKKGYTIYKECISSAEQQDIRNELTVKPYIPKSPSNRIHIRYIAKP